MLHDLSAYVSLCPSLGYNSSIYANHLFCRRRVLWRCVVLCMMTAPSKPCIVFSLMPFCSCVISQEGGAMALCGAPHDDRSRRTLLCLLTLVILCLSFRRRAVLWHCVVLRMMTAPGVHFWSCRAVQKWWPACRCVLENVCVCACTVVFCIRTAHGVHCWSCRAVQKWWPACRCV